MICLHNIYSWLVCPMRPYRWALLQQHTSYTHWYVCISKAIGKTYGIFIKVKLLYFNHQSQLSFGSSWKFLGAFVGGQQILRLLFTAYRLEIPSLLQSFEAGSVLDVCLLRRLRFSGFNGLVTFLLHNMSSVISSHSSLLYNRDSSYYTWKYFLICSCTIQVSSRTHLEQCTLFWLIRSVTQHHIERANIFKECYT